MRYIGKYYGDNGLIPFIVDIANHLLTLAFPPGTYCLCCGKYIDERRTYLLCDHCIHHFTWGMVEVDLKRQQKKTGREMYLDRVIACMKYGIYERRLIFSLKYNKETFVARVLAEIMEDRLKGDGEIYEQLKGEWVMIPVPLHKSKEKTRGFNQTAKIGKYLSPKIEIPLLENILIRKKETVAQRSLSAEDRYFNMVEAFGIDESRTEKIKGKSILLIDDVYTTGSTANHCAKVLKDAGCQQVVLLAVATGNDFAKGFFTEKKIRKVHLSRKKIIAKKLNRL